MNKITRPGSDYDLRRALDAGDLPTILMIFQHLEVRASPAKMVKTMLCTELEPVIRDFWARLDVAD